MTTLGSAISWAVGNVLVKRLERVEMLHLMVWASLVPPLPALAISFIVDGPQPLWTALATVSWSGIAAPIYLGIVASIFAYAIWGNLLQRYSAGAVAPFALLSPCVGAVASAFVFGERYGPLRIGSIAFMLVGLAIVSVPIERLKALRMRMP